MACLCLLLVAHVTITERPFAGWSAQLAVMACALALFVVWTMLSGEWSDSPARALVESDRALLYLLMLVFVGLHARGPGRLAALLALGGAGDRGGQRDRAADPPAAGHVPDQGRRQQRAPAVPADVLERHGDVLRARRDPRDALHGLRARAGVGAGGGSGGAARRRGDALLHVLARRDRGGDRRHGRSTSSWRIRGVWWRRCRPPGSRWRSRCTRPTAPICSREYNYAGADARAQGRSLLVVVIACMVAAGVLRWLALRIDRRMLRRADRHAHAHDRVQRRGHRRAARARRSRRRRSTSPTGSPSSTGRSSAATRRRAAPTSAPG